MQAKLIKYKIMKIKVLLAAPRWYCAGVNRAIQIVDKAIVDYGTPLYVNHEIIHNKYIISHFENKGVIFWEKVENIDAWNIIVFSAHWIWPEFVSRVRKQWLQFIDASCPLVVKVHNEAQKFLSEWYEIIYIWKKWHQEAEWIKEESREHIHIISNATDLENINFWAEQKVALLTQTTLSVSETEKLIEDVKKKFPNVVLPKAWDICYATTNRQKAVHTICKTADMLIVVGSKNSSNSSKLQHIWEEYNIESLLIDSYKELDGNVLETLAQGKETLTIAVSGWASAPEKLIQELIKYLESIWDVEIEEVTVAEEKIVFPSKLILCK